MDTRTLQLSEGKITLRALTPAEIEQLHAIETANQADASIALARYMPLITAAAVTIETRPGADIPKDLTALDYILGTSDIRGLWIIVRTMYELSGLVFPEELFNFNGDSFGRVPEGSSHA